MRLPRDLSGSDLAHRLQVLGYRPTRTAGSHQRLTTTLEGGHHVTIPLASSLRVGTLAAILSEVAAHFGMTREDLLKRLFE
ncbi:MAG: type II toxin-antitoxin system HicA family toxin [Candidatus Hydrogenedentes bacterium]|nr:type II toxin-antitoxin system HicA family toxin [Candidatus Hydrogenedentota bacterium]